MRPYAALLALLLVGPAFADEPKVAGTDVPAPKRSKFVLPEYPVEAQVKGLRGIVILELVIDEQGHVEDVRVLRSVPPFDEPALAAVRKWEYEPSKVDGKPVRVRLTVPITFALKLPEMARQEGIPELRSGAAPGYPTGAQAEEHVSVSADVTLDPDGVIAAADVKLGGPPFSDALLAALRTWRFALDSRDPAILSFRVDADFIRDARGAQGRVELKLSGLRKSEPVPGAADAAAAKPSPAPAAAPVAAAPVAAPPPPPVEVVAARRPPAQAPPASEPESGVSIVRDVTLGANIPELSKGRRPIVPPLARMAESYGSVQVQFYVENSGSTSVQSATGSDLLKAAAQQTVDSWVFRRTSLERLALVASFSYGREVATATIERAH